MLPLKQNSQEGLSTKAKKDLVKLESLNTIKMFTKYASILWKQDQRVEFGCFFIVQKTSAAQLFAFVGESVKFYCEVRLSNECAERQRISMNAVIVCQSQNNY